MPLLMEETNDADAETRETLPKTPVLITAATRWEYAPLAKALGLFEAVPGRAEGIVGGRKVVLLKTGIGAKNVDTALAVLRGTVPLAPLDAVKMAKHYMWFSSEKAKKELGFAPRPAKAALKDAVAWYLANGYAKLQPIL